MDGVFYARIRRLLGICVPSWKSPEAGYLVLVAVSMVARTLCDLWMISINTTLERTIITRDSKSFAKNLVRFILSMLPISIVNNLLKYGLEELKMRFRERLTTHLYKQYLSGYTYYGIVNLDSRISNVDQLLTQDVARFSNSIASMYSNVSKPLLDILIFSRRLGQSIGAQGPGYMILYLLASGSLLTWLRKPMGRLTMVEQQLEVPLTVSLPLLLLLLVVPLSVLRLAISALPVAPACPTIASILALGLAHLHRATTGL